MPNRNSELSAKVGAIQVWTPTGYGGLSGRKLITQTVTGNSTQDGANSGGNHTPTATANLITNNAARDCTNCLPSHSVSVLVRRRVLRLLCIIACRFLWVSVGWGIPIHNTLAINDPGRRRGVGNGGRLIDHNGFLINDDALRSVGAIPFIIIPLTVSKGTAAYQCAN